MDAGYRTQEGAEDVTGGGHCETGLEAILRKVWTIIFSQE